MAADTRRFKLTQDTGRKEEHDEKMEGRKTRIKASVCSRETAHSRTVLRAQQMTRIISGGVVSYFSRGRL